MLLGFLVRKALQNLVLRDLVRVLEEASLPGGLLLEPPDDSLIRALVDLGTSGAWLLGLFLLGPHLSPLLQDEFVGEQVLGVLVEALAEDGSDFDPVLRLEGSVSLVAVVAPV